ncbi:MAG: chorismate synthase [Bacteroidales bacterium]
MSANTFGTIFRLTTFGESHGIALGGIIDGCPAGLHIDVEFIQQELNRRRPGQSEMTTPRDEKDAIEILSGVFEGRSTGSPIAFEIRNKDQHSSDYDHLKNAYRPSHADFTYDSKYGFRDYRGGGRSSARETLSRVAGGAIAKLLLLHSGIRVKAFVSSIGEVKSEKGFTIDQLDKIEESLVRCPDTEASDRMIDLITRLKKEGDTTGGVITCIIDGVPPGLGEPVFDKLQADLAKAAMSINTAKGFEYGEGFNAPSMRGSTHNDIFTANEKGEIRTVTNHSGGIQGGISNGSDIIFKVAFKPIATILQAQQSVTNTGENIELAAKGRHDVCVVPRAVPIVEAMAALVIADHLLRNRSAKL